MISLGPKVRTCVLCGSSRNIEMHHVAGRAFAITAPLCHTCHVKVTVGLKRLRVDTSDKVKTLLPPLQAITFLQFMILDKLGGKNR